MEFILAMFGISIGIGLTLGAGSGDVSPGGSADALLMEDNSSGFLLEDGTSDLLMES